MTRKLLVVGSLLFSLAEFASAQTPSNVKTDKLVGNVKTVRTERTWTTRNVEGKRVLMTVESYDRRGSKTEWDAYMGRDQPTRGLFTYDDNGNATQEVWYDSADQLMGKTLFSYDPKGNLIEENSSNGIRIIYSYDSHNNRISQRILDLAKDEGPRMFGPVEKTVRYSYDRKNHLKEVSTSNPNGSRAWNPALQAHRIVYAYNGKGQTISQTVFNANNAVRTSTRYVYDPLGRVEREFLFTAKDGIVRVFRYAYKVNGSGNWTVQTKSKRITRGGKRIYVPIETVYRDIEYY